ncbi:hypothetical protein DFH06DRAFT_553533 [Mycena polygramma]|nr:hypothetical protein DFH06DRAFT_553533 [Mycena polygramma]
MKAAEQNIIKTRYTSPENHQKLGVHNRALRIKQFVSEWRTHSLLTLSTHRSRRSRYPALLTQASRQQLFDPPLTFMLGLPQELVDDILDYWVDSDPDGRPDAMRTCGLVCKRWLPRSRFHLFSRVTLDAADLPWFVRIIDSNSIPILSYILHLTLRFAGRQMDDALLTRLHGCPNLTSVEVSISSMSHDTTNNAQFFRALQKHLPLLASNPASFSRFNFRLPSHPLEGIPVGTIVDILGCIPSVEYVAVDGVYSYIIPDPEFTRREAPVSPLYMRTLEVRTYQGVQLLTSALLSHHTLPNLRSLTLRAGLDPIEDFIARVGAQLESLSLSFLEAPRAVPTIGRFVRYTTHLRSLQVFLLEPAPILNILAVLPPYNWDTLIFVLIKEDYNYARTVIHWGGIDSALADARFATLRHFLLKRIAGVADRTPVVMPETRMYMPLANKRGILG